MNAAQIKKRMAELGVDRAWLAEKCHWSLSNVVNVLAPKGSNRSPKAIARIVEVLDAESRRRQAPAVAYQNQQVVLHPDKMQYDLWSAAHNRWVNAHKDHANRTLVDWAMYALDSLSQRKFSVVGHSLKNHDKTSNQNHA